MTVTYINARLIVCDDGSFGMIVEGEGKIFYRSLSFEREKVERLVRLINEGEVSELHVGDIVEDFLE